MYTYKSRVRYSETDKSGKLSIEALLNYFQDCSTFQSEDIGFGLTYLMQNKRVWVMTAWQIVVNRYPELCENIIVGTAPYEFRGFIGYRNFVLQTEAGELLACANSVWTLLDTESGRPAKPSREMMDSYILEEKLNMDYASRKIELVGAGIELPPIDVKSHHLDTNNHVNNGQYISMAMDCIAAYETADKGWKNDLMIGQLRAEYRKSAVLGDVLTPRVMENGKNILVISLQDKEGHPFCNVELMRKEEK